MQRRRDRRSRRRNDVADTIRARLEKEVSHKLADIVRDAFQAVSEQGDPSATKRESFAAICEHLVRKTSLQR